jgi:hypothetical protein
LISELHISEILSIFLVFLILSVGIYFNGFVFLKLIKVFNKKFSNSLRDYHFSVYLLTGLLLSIFILQVIYLFRPVSSDFWKISFLLGILILAWKKYKHKTAITITKFHYLSISSAFLLLMNSTTESNYYDLGLYYVPLSSWMEQFPVIPGLANIHGRFAYSPQHIVLATSMNDIFNAISGFTVLTGFISLLVIILNTRLLGEALRLKNTFAIILSIGIYFVLVFLYSGKNAQTFLTSSSSDSLVIILLIAILILITNYFLSDEPEFLYLSFFTALTMFGFRLNSLPVSIFIFTLILLRLKLTRNNVLLILISGLIVTLPNILIRTIFSGYPLYPLSLVRIDFNFTVPVEYVRNESAAITSSGVGSFNFYFSNIIGTLNGGQIRILIIISLLIITFCAFMLFLFRRKSLTVYLLSYFISLPIFISWIFSPDPRFILFIVIAHTIIILSYLLWISPLNRLTNKNFALVTLIGIQFLIYLTQISVLPSIPVKSLEDKVGSIGYYNDKMGNIIYFNNLSDQCWNIQIPCTPGDYTNRFYFNKNNFIGGIYPG